MGSIQDRTRIKIKLIGTRELMFDRYAGKDTKLPVADKLYLSPAAELLMPELNIMSYLTAVNSPSATQLVFGKVFRKFCRAFSSCISVEDGDALILRNGKPIKFTALDKNGEDKQAGIYTHKAVARLAKGIPNDKERPTLKLPWEIEFNLIVEPANDFSLNDLKSVWIEGGRKSGMGTFRPRFGQFICDKFVDELVKDSK